MGVPVAMTTPLATSLMAQTYQGSINANAFQRYQIKLLYLDQRRWIPWKLMMTSIVQS